MKLRTVLAGAVGALGTAAVVNAVLTRRADDLPPAVVGEQQEYRWRGMDVAYTERGDPDDPDLLMLHGVSAAGSSHEFAEVVDEFAEDHHVLVPDLPGFGRSDRPPLIYSPTLYEGFIADFIRDKTENPTVVGSSLTGAYLVTAAGKPDVEVARLILVSPTTETMPGQRTWLRSVLRTPLVGTTVNNLLTSKPAIRHFSADHGYYDPSEITDEQVEYQWQSAHQPGARYAPASFISGYLDPDIDLAEQLNELDVPTTLVWGRETETTPLSEGRTLADRSDARLVVVDYARLLPHAEHPETFAKLLREELSLPEGE